MQRQRPVLLPLHRQPVSMNCVCQRLMEFLSGGSTSSCRRKLRWTVITDVVFAYSTAQNAFFFGHGVHRPIFGYRVYSGLLQQLKRSICFIHFMVYRCIIWQPVLSIYWHLLISVQLCCIFYTLYIYTYINIYKVKMHPITVHEDPEGSRGKALRFP